MPASCILEADAPVRIETFEPLTFDRRRFQRDPAIGSFTAIVADPSGKIGLIPVDLLDQSRGGVGLACRRHLEPGTRVSLAPTANPLPGNSATVARCDRVGQTYHVGLDFDDRLAA